MSPTIESLLTISGRVPRKVYWYMMIAQFAATIAASILDAALFGYDAGEDGTESGLPVISLIVIVLCMWVNFVITAKRWHDRDKSAWWMLIGFVPVIGTVWQIIECGFLSGTKGENRFGPSPRA